ncbi:MAG: hypothetical protein J6Y10_02485 [Lachnospiraceae bacterium]|nr:hypothetical protein [Lachnospiraceae bacterium]
MSHKVSKHKIKDMLRNEQPEPMSQTVDERILSVAAEHFSKKGAAMSVSPGDDGYITEGVAQSSRSRVWETIGAAAILVGVVALTIVIISKRKPDGKTTVPAENDPSPSVTTQPTPGEPSVTPTGDNGDAWNNPYMQLFWAEQEHWEHEKAGVEEFREAGIAQGVLSIPGELNAYFYNATPKQLEELTGVRIFKLGGTHSGSYEYLMYEGEVFVACDALGDAGVCQIAVADLNEDGYKEVYYTSLSGSGITSIAIHCFDTATKKVYQLLYRVDSVVWNESDVPERPTPGLIFGGGGRTEIGLWEANSAYNMSCGKIEFKDGEPRCEFLRDPWALPEDPGNVESIESGTDLVLLWAENADSEHAADGVEEFRSAATDQGLLTNAFAQQAEYYNAAPKQLEELTGVTFFKRKDSNKTFDYLMYEGTVYEACPSTGDVGVCQIAVADLNRDGKPEVYFTSLSGSGMTTFAIHYFDTATRKMGELLRHQNIESYNESFVPERREPQVFFAKGYIGGIGLGDSGPMSSWWGWITYNGDEPVCKASTETWSEKSRREQEHSKQQDTSDKITE